MQKEKILNESDQQGISEDLTSPVDPGALTEIFGDDSVAKTGLLQKFSLQAEEIVEALETAYEQRDIEQIAFHTHKLKSSARTVGANNLADICFSLEMAARNVDWGEIDNLFSSLRPNMQSVKDYTDGLSA